MVYKSTKNEILKVMKKSPTKLFSLEDLMKALRVTFKDSSDAKYLRYANGLHNTYRTGFISRHIDKNEKNQIQYALKIPANKCEIYNPVSYRPKKAKSATGDIKALRQSFSDIMNQLAQIEDQVMAMAEKQAIMDKHLAKIKEIT